MNDEVKRHPFSAPGKYYVDSDTCLDHQCCIEIAPNNFKMNTTSIAAYVCKQPTTAAEEAQCREALEACPVAAIHDDGETQTDSNLRA